MVIIFLLTDNHADLCPFLILRRCNTVSVTHAKHLIHLSGNSNDFSFGVTVTCNDHEVMTIFVVL